MLDLPGSKPVAAALQALAAAEEQLEQWVAGTGGSASSGSSGGDGGGKGGGGGTSGSPQQQPGSAALQGSGWPPSSEQAAALLARIRFRRLVLEAAQSLQVYSQAGVEAARRQCQLAEAQLALVEGSAGLAAAPNKAPGFVPDINRQHMGLVPPRRVHVSTPLRRPAGSSSATLCAVCSVRAGQQRHACQPCSEGRSSTPACTSSHLSVRCALPCPHPLTRRR